MERNPAAKRRKGMGGRECETGKRREAYGRKGNQQKPGRSRKEAKGKRARQVMPVLRKGHRPWQEGSPDKVEEIPRRMTGLTRDEKDILRRKEADMRAAGAERETRKAIRGGWEEKGDKFRYKR